MEGVNILIGMGIGIGIDGSISMSISTSIGTGGLRRVVVGRYGSFRW